MNRGAQSLTRHREGLALFIGKAGCSTCDVGPLFTDGDFHNTGVAWRNGTFADSGRAAVTGLTTSERQALVAFLASLTSGQALELASRRF